MKQENFARNESFWRRVVPLPVVFLAAFVMAGVSPAWAVHPSPTGRIVLETMVPPQTRAMSDAGPAPADLPMKRMILVLAREPGAAAALAQLLEDQQNPASPRYHQWLTPEEFGSQFGLPNPYLAKVTGWLKREGFTIDSIARGRGWIDFSGTAADVERAFQTQIHDYVAGRVLHHSNATVPSLPASLSGLVKGIVSLNDFPRQAENTGAVPAAPRRLRPDYTSARGENSIGPADFAAIYDVNPLYNAGTNGQGVSLAIVARTDVSLTDVEYFRSFFGLPKNDPQVIHNGTDPGDLGGGEETEADLDTEWSGAVAPMATIKLVVSASTATSDGVDLSAQYIVDNNLAPVMSESFGSCENQIGAGGEDFYNELWAQAAAQGISVFISSGDSGAAGCGSSPGVSGISSTPYNVCVGGTMFDEGIGHNLTYWNTTNDPTTNGSAKSYIPEVAWHEFAVDGASTGGASIFFPKPAWQVAPGVPNDGARDLPDVSLNAAANHDPYLIVQGHATTATGLMSVGGTSASSPSMAGLMALIVQKMGGAQGNPNPILYRLGNSQYSTSGPAVFHDVTVGDNSLDGVTGYSCGPGFDQVTGLGSVDASVLAASWSSAAAIPDFALEVSGATVNSPVLLANAGNSFQIPFQLLSINGFNSPVALTLSGAGGGISASFNSTTLTGSGTVTLTISVGNSVPNGTSATIKVTGTGGGLAHAAFASLYVIAPVPINISSLTIPASGSVPFGITKGSDGALWFADNGTSAIGRVTTSGNVTEYPVAVTGGDSATAPNEIVTGPDGNLWFTEIDAGTNAGANVGRISPNGTGFTEFPLTSANSGPYAICVGSDNNLWVTEINSNNIARITTSGVVTEYPVPTAGSSPNFITAGPDGAIWFTEYSTNKIGRITTSGVVTEFTIPTADSSPQGITAGSDHNLWFVEADGNNVGRLTPSGVFTEFPIPSGQSFPNGIVTGPDGALWFTEEATNQIGRITTSGAVTEYGVSKEGSVVPYDIVVGSDNNLWFTESTAAGIGLYNFSAKAPGPSRNGAPVKPVPLPPAKPVSGRG